MNQDHEYKVEKNYKQISGHSILWPRLVTKQVRTIFSNQQACKHNAICTYLLSCN
jgi:hypothetical protein